MSTQDLYSASENPDMTYDPFTNTEKSDTGTVGRLLSVRQAPIFNKKLVALEWASDSRKRARIDSNHTPFRDSTQISSAQQLNETLKTHQHRSENPDHVTAAPPKPQTESVRVIEKPVFVEPVTIMGVAPLVDDRVRHLVHFILKHVDSPNVEIEAKLGVVIEKEQDVRVIQLVPVMCETPIVEDSNSDVRFVSDVGEDLFYRLNHCLNKRVDDTAGQDGGVGYNRVHELDSYHPGRVRHIQRQRDVPDGSKVFDSMGAQKKTRLGDMNVLCPGRLCDIRYSASREETCTLPPGEPDTHRMKDRVSYQFEYISVDLTNVEMRSGKSENVERTHEVEVEISESTNLFEEVSKYKRGDESSKIFDIATSLVNTVRLLLEH